MPRPVLGPGISGDIRILRDSPRICRCAPATPHLSITDCEWHALESSQTQDATTLSAMSRYRFELLNTELATRVHRYIESKLNDSYL
jgi:hypothetical protein